MKKSLDKIAKRNIVQLKNKSISDSDIYNQLSHLYYNKDALAFLIATTTSKDLIKKYSRHNNIFIILLSVNFILDLLPLILYVNPIFNDPFFYLIRLLTSGLSNVVFIYFVTKHKYYIYKIAAFFPMILGIEQLLIEFLFYDLFINFYFVSKLIVSFGILIMGINLVKNIYPNYVPYVKKDKKGNYLFK